MSFAITKPTLLVDESTCRNNIRKMAAKAEKSGVALRPHFKTHQSADIANWFKEEGISKATVSSVEMATYFADNGWHDITIAFPYNPLEHKSIEQLAQRIKLNVLIESEESLKHINDNINSTLGYFIKIDVGTGRTGITSSQFNVLPKLRSKNPKHELVGLLAHAGHAYKKIDRAEALKIYSQSVEILSQAKSLLGDQHLMLSYGDTPTCSLLDDFSTVNEIRPGNFVFYDAIQNFYGSCGISDIAVCMACPVVAIHKDRNEIVVYGGGVHFSKDSIKGSDSPYGLVVTLTPSGWQQEPIAKFVRLSQEHGIISGSDNFISSLKIGDLVGILPVHSCMAADLQGSYRSLSGMRLSKLNKE
ncbi:MAG: alanine racemase [Cyclobacteriaceae bacterium]